MLPRQTGSRFWRDAISDGLIGYSVERNKDQDRHFNGQVLALRGGSIMNARNVAAGLPELVARIGLDSGPVIVAAEGDVFGEAPNIAARVQAAAEPAPRSSLRASSGRSPGSSSLRTRARTNSKASRPKPTAHQPRG
jgi:class 3 adenylate cyclase